MDENEITADFEENLQELVNLGEEQGYLLGSGQVKEALGSLDDEEMEQVVDYLEGKNIDVLPIDSDIDEDDLSEGNSDISELNESEEDSDDYNDSPDNDLSDDDLLYMEDVESESDKQAVVDSVRVYLNEIGSYPLLTADEEIELAKQIENGDKNAKDKMMNSNLRLVVNIAKKYRNLELSFMDLIQAGSLGLIDAVEKFDYRKGNRFSTFAYDRIRGPMLRAIQNQSRTIRIPANNMEMLNKINKATEQLGQELRREPTREEIAEKVNSLDKNAHMTAEKVADILIISQPPKSLDSPVGKQEEEEDKETLGDITPDPKASRSMNAYLYRSLRELLNDEIMDTLTEREQKILRYRFGVDDGHVRTAKETARQFDIAVERVRQIEAEALRKLIDPCKNKGLRDYLSK